MESSFGGLDWNLKLSEKERAEFQRLCLRQQSSPGEVLRQLMKIYVRARGRMPITPQEFDRVVTNLSSWWLQPERKRPRAVPSARKQHPG